MYKDFTEVALIEFTGLVAYLNVTDLVIKTCIGSVTLAYIIWKFINDYKKRKNENK